MQLYFNYQHLHIDWALNVTNLLIKIVWIFFAHAENVLWCKIVASLVDIQQQNEKKKDFQLDIK